MESLEKLFTFYNVVDCPLDEQVMWEKTLSGIRFMTAEEAKAYGLIDQVIAGH